MNIFHFHLMPWPYLPDDYHGPSWIRVDGNLFDAGLGMELYNRYLDELVGAEALGFDGVCVNEHHQNAYGLMGSPNLLATALARQTERMKIAVCGNAVPLYNPPQRVAEEYALIDNISRGRLVAGLVIGGGPEYVSFGINPTEARGRFREAVDLILQCWTRPGPFEFHGDYYDYRYVNSWPRPVQKPFPEIWIPGTGSKETIEYIAERRFSYMGIPYFRFRAFKRNFDTFRAACETSGYQAHPAQMGMLLPIYVSDTDASARAEYEPHFDYFRNKLQEGVGRLPAGYTSATSLAMSMMHFGDVIRTATDWDDLVSDFIVVGSVETVKQRLSDLAGELGFGTLLALLQMGSLPADLTRQNQGLFATEVLPYLKEQFAVETAKPAMASAPGPVDRARVPVVTDNPLVVETRGAGEPLVWLGSGFGEAPWTKVSESLAGDHTVLSLVYPTLASGGLTRLRDVDDFTFNLVRVLDEAGIEKAVFVGSSLGGWLAADFAARYPERVKALVLVAPAGIRHPDTKAEDVFYVSVTDLGPLLIEDREHADLAAIPALHPETEPLDALVALTEGLETLARFGWNPYLNDPRLRERLVRWTGPSLVLWGSEDKVLPVEHADLWAEHLGAKVQVIDGVGHLAALERPDELIEAIGAWLTTDGAPAESGDAAYRSMSDVLYEKDRKTHIARVTLNRPEKLNAMTVAMYEAIIAAMDDVADDDDIKVVILRGAGGCFTSGVDMAEVYSWYDDPAPASEDRKRRPSQRRRLVVDRKTQRVYDRVVFHPKVTIAQVEKYALGGGLEFLMACDLSVVGAGTKVGMPATRFLGPVLGDLHLFFHRLGPVLTKDLLLTGRTADADELAHLGVFTRFVPADAVQRTTEELAELVARMPADGIVIAKEAYRLVEQSMGMALSEVSSYLLHVYATNLQFEDDEFNFVRTRSGTGLAESFDKAESFYAGESS